MLRAGQKDYKDAIRRADAYLESPAAAESPLGLLIDLMSSRASWLESSGDVAGAFAANQRLWETHKNRDDRSVIEAGLYVAGKLAVTVECAQKLELAEHLVQRLDALRANPPKRSIQWTAESIQECLRQALVCIVDASDCARAEVAAKAKGRLEQLRAVQSGG